MLTLFNNFAVSLQNRILLRNMSSALQLKKKYDGRSKKRKWEERRSDNQVNSDKKICPDNFLRVKRRKYAVLLGYCGVNYYGMQRNPFTKTIEEELFNAFLKAEIITNEAFNQIQTIQYQRAARTDKGVSAIRQIISLKLPDNIDTSSVNRQLPDCIKIFGVKRVTKGFNSKSQCDGRTYTYLLPTVSFSKPGSDTSQDSFRLNAETHSKVNEVLNMFVGTKNYHNFTNKKKPTDPSATRYIMSFYCESPILCDGVEFAVLKIKGQSFMLHQIRKMIGLSLALLRDYTGLETLQKAWTLEKVNIPQAPGLGLVLDAVHYERYNYRYGNDGVHEPLDWSHLDEEVNTFKEKYIYPTIIETEIKEKSFLNWLETRLAIHNYSVLEDVKDNKEDEEEDDDTQ